MIENRSSGAPGIRIGNVYVLAGVPDIAASMLQALSGKLEGGRPMVADDGWGILHHRQEAGAGHAAAQAQLEQIQAQSWIVAHPIAKERPQEKTT